MNLKNKKIAVIGLSKRTGVTTAKFLAEKGAQVIVSDIKSAAELKKEISLLKNYNIDYDLGGHSEKILNTELIVVSPGVPLDTPFFARIKQRNIPIISEIELAFQMTSAKIIGITGTNGKTTTTSLIGDILNNSSLAPVPVAGNIGTPLIGEINGLKKDGWIVAEISSFQLETIDQFKPKISLFLNFSPDHLDRHKSIDNYYNAKKNIFLNQGPDDYAIFNYDDNNVKKAAQNCKAECLYVSLNKEVSQGIYLKDNILRFKYSNHDRGIINCNDIPLMGQHNLYNTAFAILCTSLLNIKEKIIRETIKSFKPDKHRLEKIVFLDNGTLIIDDSKATNPDSAIKAIQSIDQPIILIAGGQERGLEYKKFAKEISSRVKSLILMGETRDKIYKSVLNEGFTNIFKVSNMNEAVKIALKEFNSGDCILLSPGCPSWDMYESYKKRGEDFVNELVKQSSFVSE